MAIDDDASGAIIVGGAHGSLAVARSLGRRGIPVWFVSDDHPITKFSRYTARSFDWPGPGNEDAAAWLLDFAARHRLERWVLFAGGDEEVQLIAQHHAFLSRAFRVTTPPWVIARFACDKRLMHQHAASVGVDSPRSVYPANHDELAATSYNFPVVIKPTYRTGRNALTTAKAWKADDRATLMRRYDEAVAIVGANALFIQEYIPGDGDNQFSCAVACDQGTLIASLVARRTRQYPVDFGFTSTYVETIELQEVREAARRFLASLNFSGLAEIEFKYDARDGQYKLLDVNPRPWTWIGLGAAAGVDFAWTQWLLACGKIVPMSSARPGIAWSHVSRDLVSVTQRLARGAPRPGRDLASLARPTTFAAFATDDPVPGVIDLPILIARMIERWRPALSGFLRAKYQAQLQKLN